MKHTRLSRLPLLLVLLISLVFLNLQVNKRSSQTDNCFNICGDARGYYAWLPAIFIYHDLSFHFFDTVEMIETNCGSQVGIPIQDYRLQVEGKTINKYYPGTSFMMLPFFAVAHLVTKYASHYPANGYAPLYFRIMGLGGVFYYFVGMLFMLGVLGLLQLNVLQKSLAVLFISFGTNLMYYAIDAPVYSHVYSFTLVAAFLYYALRVRESLSARHLACLALIVGWIFVARPVNITVILSLPFLFYGRIAGICGMVKSKPVYLLALLPALTMPAILCALYKAATGSYMVYSYGKEGFDFLHPHLLQFMFGYNNGIMPYMPLLFMPLFLLFAWYKKEQFLLVAAMVFTLLVSIYVHSAWWAWDYGFSFGARTMLDLVPLFGILVGLSLKQDKLKHYFYIIPLYLLCCAVTLVLYHQKSHGGYMAVYPIHDYWPALRNVLK